MTSKKTGPNDDLHYDAWLRALGKRLAAHRKRMGITQAKAADTCGIDVKFYQDLEYGRRPCSTRTLFGVTSSLGIGIDEAVPTKNECDSALTELHDRRVRNGLIAGVPNHIPPGATPSSFGAPNGQPMYGGNGSLQSGPGIATASAPAAERHAVLGGS
jgi:transcriptional regulator with XRE-family HTH domain